MKKSKFVLVSSLPIDIFYHHIFLKLPFKSLVRFKSVCKEWNNIISDQHFVTILHLLHATTDIHKKKLLLHSAHFNTYYSIDHHTIGGRRNGVHAVNLHFPFQDALPTPYLTITIGSVNGLVCALLVMNHRFGIIIVWNPTTKQYKKLPPNPHVPVKVDHRIGFGYDPIADDYKVMRIVHDEQPRLDIYSLKNDSWKLTVQGTDIPALSPITLNQIRSCSVDGSIYWLACHMNGDNLKDPFMACFDLNDDVDHEKKKKLIREVAMPNDFDTVVGTTDMKLVGGCLAVYKMNNSDLTVVMWTLTKIKRDSKEEYGWSKKLVITADKTFSLREWDILYRMRLLPVCLSIDGKILLWTPDIDSTELLLYDPKTNTMKEFHPTHWISETGKYLEDIQRAFFYKPTLSQNEIYIETLVSPNFTRPLVS